MAEVQIEDYVAPAEKPHELRPVVEKLIEAGPDKIATIIADTEDDAKAFLRGMQAAARQLDKGARKRVWEDAGKGKIKVGVSVGQKFSRNRKPKDESSPETE